MAFQKIIFSTQWRKIIMFERFKNLIHGLKDEHTYYIFVGTMLYSLFMCGCFLTMQENNPNHPSLALLGYSLWLTDAFHYFFFRFWSYVPLIVFAVSVVGIAKTLITGKCSILKGLSFGDVIFINTITAMLFLLPFAIEGALYIAVVVSIFLAFLKLCGATITRFDSACVDEQKEEASLFTKNNVSQAQNSVLSKKGKRYDAKRYSLEDLKDASHERN